MSKPMIIIVGPSGSGKNYIPKVLGMNYTPGNTTREKRENDEFMTYHKLEEVKSLRCMNMFDSKICGETTFHNNYYWTYIRDYNDPQYDYMVLSPEGLMNFIKKFNKHKEIIKENLINNKLTQSDKILIRDYRVVYFECSEKQRKKNMKARGDKRCDIKSRIKHDREVYSGIKEMVLNDLNGELIKI